MPLQRPLLDDFILGQFVERERDDAWMTDAMTEKARQADGGYNFGLGINRTRQEWGMPGTSLDRGYRYGPERDQKTGNASKGGGKAPSTPQEIAAEMQARAMLLRQQEEAVLRGRYGLDDPDVGKTPAIPLSEMGRYMASGKQLKGSERFRRKIADIATPSQFDEFSRTPAGVVALGGGEQALASAALREINPELTKTLEEAAKLTAEKAGRAVAFYQKFVDPQTMLKPDEIVAKVESTPEMAQKFAEYDSKVKEAVRDGGMFASAFDLVERTSGNELSRMVSSSEGESFVARIGNSGIFDGDTGKKAAEFLVQKYNPEVWSEMVLARETGAKEPKSRLTPEQQNMMVDVDGKRMTAGERERNLLESYRMVSSMGRAAKEGSSELLASQLGSLYRRVARQQNDQEILVKHADFGSLARFYATDREQRERIEAVARMELGNEAGLILNNKVQNSEIRTEEILKKAGLSKATSTDPRTAGAYSRTDHAWAVLADEIVSDIRGRGLTTRIDPNVLIEDAIARGVKRAVDRGVLAVGGREGGERLIGDLYDKVRQEFDVRAKEVFATADAKRAEKLAGITTEFFDASEAIERWDADTAKKAYEQMANSILSQQDMMLRFDINQDTRLDEKELALAYMSTMFGEEGYVLGRVFTDNKLAGADKADRVRLTGAFMRLGEKLAAGRSAYLLDEAREVEKFAKDSRSGAAFRAMVDLSERGLVRDFNQRRPTDHILAVRSGANGEPVGYYAFGSRSLKDAAMGLSERQLKLLADFHSQSGVIGVGDDGALEAASAIAALQGSESMYAGNKTVKGQRDDVLSGLSKAAENAAKVMSEAEYQMSPDRVALDASHIPAIIRNIKETNPIPEALWKQAVLEYIEGRPADAVKTANFAVLKARQIDASNVASQANESLETALRLLIPDEEGGVPSASDVREARREMNALNANGGLETAAQRTQYPLASLIRARDTIEPILARHEKRIEEEFQESIREFESFFEKRNFPAWDFPTEHPAKRNKDGSLSNVLLGTFGMTDDSGVEKQYVIPTMVNGRKLSGEEAVKIARGYGLDKYPSFASVAEAEAWIKKNHANVR